MSGSACISYIRCNNHPSEVCIEGLEGFTVLVKGGGVYDSNFCSRVGVSHYPLRLLLLADGIQAAILKRVQAARRSV